MPAQAPAAAMGAAQVTQPSQVPPPPRQPTPRARQMIFAYQGSQAIERTIGIAFSLAVFPALFANYGLPGEVALLIGTASAQGTVTRVALDPGYKINKRVATKVELRFQADKQTWQESFHTIQPGALRAGSPIPVEYATIYPGFARAQGQSYSFFGFGSLGFLAVPVIGFVLFLKSWLSNRREIRAFVHGVATLGTITERTIDRSSREGRRHPRVIRWAFNVGASTYVGMISHMDHALLDSLLPGPSVVVLYDPRNPSVNTVWIC
jgi:hypothetical protein